MNSAVPFIPAQRDRAWPLGCPCCGSWLREYIPESDDEYAFWRFECDAAFILLENGMPDIETACP